MVIKIAIIGAGVNGIACGVQISDYYKEQANVTIFSEKFTPHTTGDGAAGFWCPYLLGSTQHEKIRQWSKGTHDFLEKLWLSEDAGNAGVCLLPTLRVTSSTDTGMNDYWKKTVYGWRKLTENELNKMTEQCGRKYKDGMHFATYTVEPRKLLPYLMEIFKKNKGKFIEKRVENFDNFVNSTDYDVIINCTGEKIFKLTSIIFCFHLIIESIYLWRDEI